MSKLKTNTIQHTGGSADNITLDNSQNVTAEGNLTVDGKISIGNDGTYASGDADDLIIGTTSGSANHGLTILSPTNKNAGIYFSDGDNPNGNHRGYFDYNHTTDALNIGTAGAQKVVINSAGSISVPSGQGIDFSAAASGNSPSATLFKDYEEGTFTPRLGGTTNLSTVYANGSGSYTKIGRVVTIICRFNAVNESMTGQIAISNLPFNSINDGSNYATSCDWLSHSVAWGDNMHPGFMMDATNNRWTGYLSRDDASWIDWMVGDWDANGLYLNFQGTYWTNA